MKVGYVWECDVSVPKLIPFTERIGYNGKLFRDKESLETLFLQLKMAGFDKVKLYDGSFVEWHEKQLPLE